MQVDETGVTRRLRISVGHADYGCFLQAEHVVDIVGPVAQERQFGRAGIAEHLFDPERTQQVERRLLHGDGSGASHHVAVPFMVGARSEFAVHSSMPASVSLALTLNSPGANSGCSPR